MANKKDIDLYFQSNEKTIKLYITKLIAKHKKYYKDYTVDDVFVYSYLHMLNVKNKVADNKIENFLNKFLSNLVSWSRSQINYVSEGLDYVELDNMDFSLEYVDELDKKIESENEYNNQRAKIAYFYKNILKDKNDKTIFFKMFYEFKTPKQISDETNVPYYFIQPICKRLKDHIADYYKKNENTL
jgi:hypothetical protein